MDGNAISYFSNFPTEDAETNGYFYLAKRGSTGWSTETVGFQYAPALLFEDHCGQNVFFSSDLSRNIDEEGWSAVPRCVQQGKVLVPGEPDGYRNVFVHDVSSDAYQLVNVTAQGVTPANAKFQDASDDFNSVIFSTEADLTPDAYGGYDFFVWEGGVIRLLTILPDGTPTEGDLVESTAYGFGPVVTQSSGLAAAAGAFSADGERAFFYAGNGLYMRQNPSQPQSTITGGECTESVRACTVQIDDSQGPGSSGGGIFWRASSDGSKVIFSSDGKLTPDSTAEPGKADLYEYEVETGQLTDLTPSPGESADVRGVSGAGEDGSHIYFVANGVLDAGGVPGNCAATANVAKGCNLYHYHDGSIDFVATLNGTADSNAWQEIVDAPDDPSPPPINPREKLGDVWANASPDGRYLVFASIANPTGYDNRDVDTGEPTRQIYLYDAAANGGAGQLSCASCLPNGERPSDSSLRASFGGNYEAGVAFGAAKWKLNTVLDSGRVFFETSDALLERDTNGSVDVYEFHDGEHHLISSGLHPGNSSFLDATPNGSDVFIRTPESLVGTDTDNDNVNIYDARIGGGFPEPPPSPTCEGESCRGAIPPAPLPPMPATSVFKGPGNARESNEKRPRRCVRGKGRKKQRRCARRKARVERTNRKRASRTRWSNR